MSTLLLIHGAWSASWAWDPLLPELDALDIPFKTIDLPGHGSNSATMWSVSLADYAAYVAETAEGIEGRVVTVGHSGGGFVMTAAAGQSPESFDELVYLTGFVPVEGERLMVLARGDKGSKLGPGLRPNPFLGHLSLHRSVWHDALFHDCDAESERVFEQRVEREPMRPGLKKLELRSGFQALPKSYVLCANDNAITPAYQRWMAERSKVPIRHELQCGHMPMSSNPRALARVLAEYVHPTGVTKAPA